MTNVATPEFAATLAALVAVALLALDRLPRPTAIRVAARDAVGGPAAYRP